MLESTEPTEEEIIPILQVVWVYKQEAKIGIIRVVAGLFFSQKQQVHLNQLVVCGKKSVWVEMTDNA